MNTAPIRDKGERASQFWFLKGKKTMTKKALLYLRVSTDEQKENGYGLTSQFYECIEYDGRLGYEIVGEKSYKLEGGKLVESSDKDATPVYIEEYSGFSPFGDRPVGKAVMAMLKNRQADAIIVARVDRIARDSLEARIAARIWIKAGIELHTASKGRITDDNDIVFLVETWQGQEDYTKIVKNLRDGRNSKVRGGKVLGTNRAPYGYQFVQDKNNDTVGLQTYEVQAGIVRLIFTWYVKERLTMYAIARKLEEMKIPTPGGERYASRGARGIWSYVTVATLLLNETYAGKWHYGNRRGKLQIRMPQSEHIIVDVPAIVDRSTWTAAQEIRAMNKKNARRNAKHDYLFRGIIECGCGVRMSGRLPEGNIGRNYICNRRQLTKPSCHEPTVSAEAIEGQVWAGLKKIIVDREKMGHELNLAQARELSEREPKRDEVEAVDATIANTEKQAADLARALRQIDPDQSEDNIVAKNLRQDVKRTNAQYKEQVKRRDELLTELRAQILTDETIGNMMQYADDVRAGIEEADFAKKRYLLERLKVGVIVKDGHYFARCILGTWEGDVMRRSEIIAIRNQGLTIEASIDLDTSKSFDMIRQGQ